MFEKSSGRFQLEGACLLTCLSATHPLFCTRCTLCRSRCRSPQQPAEMARTGRTARLRGRRPHPPSVETFRRPDLLSSVAGSPCGSGVCSGEILRPGTFDFALTLHRNALDAEISREFYRSPLGRLLLYREWDFYQGKMEDASHIRTWIPRGRRWTCGSRTWRRVRNFANDSAMILRSGKNFSRDIARNCARPRRRSASSKREVRQEPLRCSMERGMRRTMRPGFSSRGSITARRREGARRRPRFCGVDCNLDGDRGIP